VRLGHDGGVSLPTPPRRRRLARRTKLVILAVVVVIVAATVAIVVSVGAPDRYAAFRRACFAGQGDSVVVLSSKTHGSAMGAPETRYELGCRQSTGKIISTYESNHR
jgi:hypothetical protein